MTEPRIADDYSFIAQRLREVEAEKMPQPEPVPVVYRCRDCIDMGWLLSNATSSGWKRCTYCDQGYDKPRPTPRR